VTDLIDDLHVEDGTLWVRPVSAFGVPYLADDFWAVYDGDVDLRRLSESVALMPFALNVAPVAWLSGRSWRLPAMDAGQAERLPRARETLRNWYGGAAWDGELVAERLEETPAGPGGGPPVVLFSGGVDSTFAAMTTPPPAVLTLVRGNDIALDNAPGWARVVREARATAERLGHRLVTVESSFRRHFRHDVLDAVDPALPNWWSHAQHGLALVGLAAPVAAHLGSRRLLLPATHAEGFADPWGSDPRLEEHASFGAVEVEHHGFALSRHGRLRALLERAEEIGAVPLRVCYSQVGADGRNCLACEKCLRTATGLLLESREPLPFGLPLAPAEVERRVRAGYSEGRFPATSTTLFHWRDVQAHARDSGGLLSPEFRQWLLDFPFDAYRPLSAAS